MPPFVKTKSVQYRAWQMREAGKSIEEICEAFDRTREEVHKMLHQARQQIAKCEASNG